MTGPCAGKEWQMFLSTLMGDWKRKKGKADCFSAALAGTVSNERRINAPTPRPACFSSRSFSLMSVFPII